MEGDASGPGPLGLWGGRPKARERGGPSFADVTCSATTGELPFHALEGSVPTLCGRATGGASARQMSTRCSGQRLIRECWCAEQRGGVRLERSRGRSSCGGCASTCWRSAPRSHLSGRQSVQTFLLVAVPILRTASVSPESASTTSRCQNAAAAWLEGLGPPSPYRPSRALAPARDIS